MTDEQLRFLAQTLTPEVIAKSLGVHPDEVRRRIRGLGDLGPDPKATALVTAIGDTLATQAEELAAVRVEIGTLAMQALRDAIRAEVLDPMRTLDPKVWLRWLQFLGQLLESGLYVGQASGAPASTHDELLAAVRQATASAEAQAR